jgi:hypothetical protein
LLDLIEPGTMHRREVDDEPRMRLQPCLYRLARMRAGVIADEMNRLDRGRNGPVQVRQERDELPLPLALVALPIDAPRARVEGGEEIQRPSPPILVLHLIGAAGLGRPRSAAARPGLQGGLLIERQDHFIGPQLPRIQLHHCGDPGTELGVPRGLGGQPHMVPPGLQFVMREDPAHRLGRNVLDEPLPFQVAGQLDAVPLGEGPAELIRSLAGQLDEVDRYGGGKTPAGDPGRVYPRGPESVC